MDRTALDKVAADLASATDGLEALAEVKALEESLRDGILNLSGKVHDVDARLRFAPNDPLRLFRSIAMFIDGGKRGITEASLGSANVALIALKLAEFGWRRTKNERNYSLLCVEEPEAHLHPQLQRSVFGKLFNAGDLAQALIVTSHSPTLAAVAPLRSIVHLKAVNGRTQAYSLADLPVTPEELGDIERYLDATRSEVLFSRGVIFVEGDAEAALMPAFAMSLGYDLGELGITVCNVAGVNFAPYVKLAGALGLPFAVVTDWDPLDGTKPSLGQARTLDIWDAYTSVSGGACLTVEERNTWMACDFNTFQRAWEPVGFFLSERTFEVSVANTSSLQDTLLNVLAEHNFGPTRTKRIEDWRGGTPVDPTQLLAMIADIGKGRLAGRLARRLTGGNRQGPAYVMSAIEHIVARV